MTDKNIAIRVRNLGKKYAIGGPQEKYLTLRDAIVNSVKAPFKRFHPTPPSEEFWALKDVSFDVEPGEVVGIIGRNGAGKSTLLKILSRITTPTEGIVELHGRVGSLLEVGTGFHPEMTGRENIFLNGSILGMKKAEIEQKFDEIVKFAEIDKFIDTPVKRYSSGMYVRLAFAVAAHLEPEILVVDEVLAVGDAEFQKKCLGKMGEVAKEGRTVLFVSHNMTAIKALCQRGILLESGKIGCDGEVSTVIDNYLKQNENNLEISISERVRDRKVSFRAKIIDIEIITKNGKRQTKLDSVEPLAISVTIQVYSKMSLSGRLEIRNQYGPVLYFCSSHQQNLEFAFEPGMHQISCNISRTFLAAGEYSIHCGLISGKNTEWVDSVEDSYRFVVNDLDIYGSGFNLTKDNAMYHVDHEWKVDIL